jgi:hypothetical protein
VERALKQKYTYKKANRSIAKSWGLCRITNCKKKYSKRLEKSKRIL